jgi:hypothetical protein
MAVWLKACRIDTVAMQATGVYSIPLYDILTAQGIQVVLVNAQHTKNVPGRKSVAQECQWLMKLHTYGLLRDSFRLEEKMEGVRTIWRLRARHVKDAGRAVQHMQKALTKMNVQLANVISDITGVSGQAILTTILKGERDPRKLADLKHEMVRASRDEMAHSLEATGALTCYLNSSKPWTVIILPTSRCGTATGNWRVFWPACRHAQCREPANLVSSRRPRLRRKRKRARSRRPDATSRPST